MKRIGKKKRRKQIDHKYLIAKSRRVKARIEKLGKKLSRNRTRIWNWIVAVAAIYFLLQAVYNLPTSPIPNSYNLSFHYLTGNAQFEAKYNELGHEHTTPVNLTFSLTGKAIGTDVVVENPLAFHVFAEVNESFKQSMGIQKIIVRPDNAFEHPPKAQQIVQQFPVPCETPQPNLSCSVVYFTPRSSNLVLNQSDTNPVVWQGSQTVIYRAPGVYGVTVELVGRNSTITYHTAYVFTINSQDYAATKRNEALTTSLTYFILFFAAIEVRRKSD